jgi:hypothetical protein
MRLVQQYHPSHGREFRALEKQFVELEYRGVLPQAERLAPISVSMERTELGRVLRGTRFLKVASVG